MMNSKTPLSCDDFSDTLADFLERDVPESTRAAMETHALSCDDCGPLLADLRKLRLDAANLGELTPSRDLWSGIAERIETPVVSIGAKSEGRRAKSDYRNQWMGLAAAALVGVTATVTYHITKQAAVSPAQSVVTVPATLVTAKSDTPAAVSRAADPATGQPAAVTAVSNKLTPEQTYDLEITRLRKIVNARRGQLDSSTVAVLEKNLRIIDNAIAECKQALQTDPASRYLNESLVGSLDSKVQLLRAAASLPTRM